ncbi:MAG: 2-hydroxyglutaryl-CoA dehydratase, partial [Planctomycetes bacterium]|nr:2-hydroxyglutaryl-CoA dehydratase [Planctomycetota bacterium]
MSITIGVDVGSTYTKAIVLDGNNEILGRCMNPTGFKLTKVSNKTVDEALSQAGLKRQDVAYIVATGIGRHQATFKDLHVTDLSATARGANLLFPGTRTVLDIGGQTMKASRISENAGVESFRLNDK